MRLVTILFFISFSSYSQYKIEIDPTFEPKVSVALELIKQTDSGPYCILVDYCNQILISSDSVGVPFPTGIINIPLRVISQTSFNNIATLIVREAYILRINDQYLSMDKSARDRLINDYELSFVKKLPREHGRSFKDRFRRFMIGQID